MEHNKQQNNQPNIPDKLGWLQRRAIKKQLKNMRKAKNKAEKTLKNNQEQKNEEHQKMNACIQEMLQIFNIEHQNKELNKKDLQKLTYEESLEIFTDSLKELEKIV